MLKVVIQVSAMKLKSRLDLTEVFCNVDDFYQSFEKHCRSIPQLTAIAQRSAYGSPRSASFADRGRKKVSLSNEFK